MKSTLLGLSILLCLVTRLTAQEPYLAAVGQDAYQPLTDPVSLNQNAVWDGDEEFYIPIGFTFYFYDRPFTDVILWEGTLLFEDEDLFFDAFGASLIDRGYYTPLGQTSLSPIGYQLEGLPGERILKIEYHETGFFLGDLEDYQSFQIWLYEAYPLIEVRFGPGMVDPSVYTPLGWDGPYIGIANYLDNEFLYLEGDPQMPTFHTADEATDGLVGTPGNGTVYRFFPESLSLSTRETQEIKAILWEVNERRLSLAGLPDGKIDDIRLYGLTGRLLTARTVGGLSAVEIDLGDLPGGIYVLGGFGEDAFFSEKIRLD